MTDQHFLLPQVSVIIPCYNGERYLRGAIQSVLAQTFTDLELLIVDDGSTDSSVQVVKEYASRDTRIKLVTHSKNRGLPAARNSGILHSRAPLLAFLDADDSWLEAKLAVQVEALHNPAVQICCTAARYEYQGYIGESLTFDPDPLTLCSRLLFRNVIPGSASSVMLRRSCLSASGLFDESLVASEDRDLWFRLALHFPFHYIDQILVVINRHSASSMSKNYERMAQGFAGFLMKRQQDAPNDLRPLLPRAWRYAHLRLAQVYYQSGQYGMARRYAARAITAAPFLPDQDLRRSLLIWLLACLPSGWQPRLAAPLHRRLISRSEM